MFWNERIHLHVLQFVDTVAGSRVSWSKNIENMLGPDTSDVQNWLEIRLHFFQVLIQINTDESVRRFDEICRFLSVPCEVR